MQVEERSWFSPSLGQEMALKVYGHEWSASACDAARGLRRRPHASTQTADQPVASRIWKTSSASNVTAAYWR
jgi:hypothetical protein